METAAIRYRVADFLKKHHPFLTMDEEHLLDLAESGRVRFHEPNEYILWQSEPHRSHVFVIQQGTVSLWDENGDRARLCDVRGAGDLLAVERFNGARHCLHSARSASDVVIYAFPAEDFESLLLKYPHARQYVAALGGVNVDYLQSGERRNPENGFLHDLVKGQTPATCSAQDSIREAARLLLAAASDTIAVVDSQHSVQAVLTGRDLLAWITAGGSDSTQPVASLLGPPPPAIGVDATVVDGILAMSAAETGVLAMTSDGTCGGRLDALITSHDLMPVFGDQPISILNQIHRAPDTRKLQELNERARAFVLQHLTHPGASRWLARFTSFIDSTIVRRILAMAGQEGEGCWCFCGSSGRGESLPRIAPTLVLIVNDDHDLQRKFSGYQHVVKLVAECYLPNSELAFEPSFYVASAQEWKKRYRDWILDPVSHEMYRGRSLFDLRPLESRHPLWLEVEEAALAAVNRDFLLLLANDCLGTLPPLTFFQDAVVDESGEETAIFRLEQSALQPLVAVGRVFGLAARQVFGNSTWDRFAMACALLPGDESIFREAEDALSVVLFQQGRIGISQGTSGSELPPALLGRYDRQVLKSVFSSVLRLLEFTGDWKWIKSL